MSFFGKLLRDRRGAIALTASQMFIGAVSLEIAMDRASKVHTAFHYEGQVAHANYGASKLAADHARSANVVVNNNVIMTAIMGPRFGVEADNMTLDANLPLTCPSCPYGALCKLCTQNKANKPRAEAKLQWVRAEQKTLWGTLGKLSGQIDNLASQQASGIVQGAIAKADSAVKIRFDDPSTSSDIWGGGNAGAACKLAAKDVMPTPVTGHAFPMLVDKNLLAELPKTLEQAMPQIVCQVTSALSNKSDDAPQLDQVKEVSDKTKDDCDSLEKQMGCSIAAAKGMPGNCGDNVTGGATSIAGSGTAHPVKNVSFASDVQEYVHCQTAAAGHGPVNASGTSYYYRSPSGQNVACTFDRDKCETDKLKDNSSDYMRGAMGLAQQIPNAAALAQSLGGSETRKPSQSGSNPKNFCACTFTQKPIDDTMVGISDGVRKIASFGQAEPSEALRKQRDYRSCGRWYFPDRKGQYAATPQDEQPFVGAWKWTQTTSCPGGGS